ncbi:MAG: type II toxin-antitoxin system CcdA family antitoxin [Acutalibacteraceae bacterium]|nr:type II toxin-antitoxin system CcdA family antitoxin [Acutalibacteraceae bacterium]
MRPLKQQISITVDSDLLEKAKKLAEYDDRSLSQFINIALKEYIKNIETNKNAQ